jgi:2-polyprenyl-3-methyl-5-hydroxy-6-metoxy-1,4-benzoquinol methylase
MMTSYAENIKNILEAIVETNPKKILDIGSAFGKYSILAREAILSIRAEKGDLTPADDIEMGCVEMAEYFKNLPWHDKLYQKHYHEDARNINWKDMPKYDLALLIDVVEHWSKEDSKKLIAGIKSTGAKVLISTPKDVCFYTEEYYGKDCPKHISQWTSEDFDGFILDKSTPQSHIFVV